MQVRREAPRRIKGTLMIKGRSQRWLAQQCGFESHSYIGRILAGKVTTVTADTAVKLAAVLEIPLDDLFVPKVSSTSYRSGKQREVAA
ncbi:helix-turn-helix domain-containing protein [Desertihabitans brevis]|nr:helix-turn-helix transcriptional regulator [Desertihabitans brevis]